MQDKDLLDLLVTIVFVVVWALLAAACRRKQQPPEQTDQVPTEPDLSDLGQIEPQPTETPIPGPPPQPKAPVQLEPAISKAPAHMPAPTFQPLPTLESPRLYADHRPDHVYIDLSPGKLREAIVIMELLDQPLSIRPSRNWWD
ncbi:MAG: hypothetical protein QHH07_04130 [Sedimentisphaerales bacterium]|nr:hypothetical protein [Sedimentisphaerales bacterium]